MPSRPLRRFRVRRLVLGLVITVTLPLSSCAVESGHEPSAATIAAALIGLIGAIGAAEIGKRNGIKQGFEDGRKHSIQKFLDVQKSQLRRAEAAIRRGHYLEARAIATAIVDNTTQWRIIQENFRALLNGRIDELSRVLETGRLDNIASTILALKEGFEGKALAVETELKKSKI